MPILTEYCAYFPVLNEVCSTFRGPLWWLSDHLQFRSLTDHEARLITENAPRRFDRRVDSGQKALILSHLQRGALGKVKSRHQATIRATALSCQVALDLVAESDPIAIPYAVVLSWATTTRLRSIQEFDVWGDSLALRKSRYKVKQDITRHEIQELYRLTERALNRKPTIEVTLTRFCSSLLKSNEHDKLIDLAISLESLIPGGGEFRFRFPYYLSLLVESTTDERMKAFKTLRSLYDARSALVHGSTDPGKVISRALDQWTLLVRYAKQCLLYLVQFESQERETTWKDHLQTLSYGQSPLIWGR